MYSQTIHVEGENQNVSLPLLIYHLENQNKILMAKVTMAELQKATSRLKLNKSPKPDGFTVEWYKTFSNSLSLLLFRTFNWVLEKGRYWREEPMALIPKEGKRYDNFSNFRCQCIEPGLQISLLQF